LLFYSCINRHRSIVVSNNILCKTVRHGVHSTY
jgi:hypothetical protein